MLEILRKFKEQRQSGKPQEQKPTGEFLHEGRLKQNEVTEKITTAKDKLRDFANGATQDSQQYQTIVDRLKEREAMVEISQAQYRLDEKRWLDGSPKKKWLRAHLEKATKKKEDIDDEINVKKANPEYGTELTSLTTITDNLTSAYRDFVRLNTPYQSESNINLNADACVVAELQRVKERIENPGTKHQSQPAEPIEAPPFK